MIKGFTIKCNNCGAEIKLDEEIVDTGGYYFEESNQIDVTASGQIDIDAVWIECNQCEQQVQVGYTMWD